MAVGQTYAINPGTAIQYFIPSGFSAPTIGVLNPNDGIAYVARNRQASNTSVGSWDYKVPSQSYALLPGLNWESVGVFYLDQSGANTKGEITVYPLETKTVIPVFQAIGRANQSAGTTVDISTGNQPQNPPANTGRLWIDNSGNLNVLNANGTNNTVLDSANAPTYVLPIVATAPLGGDLYGTVNAGHVWAHTQPIQLDRTLNVQWGTNTSEDRITIWSDANMYLDLATGVYNFRQGGTTLFTVNNGSVQVIGGGATATLQPNALTLNDAVIQRWNAGQFRISSTGGLTVNGTVSVEGSNVLNWPSTGAAISSGSSSLNVNTTLIANQFQFPNGAWLNSPGPRIVTNNPLYVNSDAPNSCGALITMTQRVGNQICMYDIGGGNCYGFGVNSNILALISGGTEVQMMNGSYNNAAWHRFTNGQHHFGTDSVRLDRTSGQFDMFVQNGSPNFRVFHVDTSWSGIQAANFQVQSSVEHAKLYKKPIQPVTNAAEIIRAVDPVYYFHVIMKDDDTPLDADLTGYPTYGFSPRQLETVVPEVVNGDFIDYNRLIPILWQAVKDIDSALHQN